MPQVMLPQSNQSVVKQYPIRDNEPDQNQILRILETLRDQYSRMPFIREKTITLLRGVVNNDLETQAKRVISFVRQNVVYVRDPQNAEYVIAPDRMLRQIEADGYSMGDCDDHVLLLNTMLGSIGIETRFVGVKFNSDRFNHVISGLNINGKSIQVDPCAKNGGRRVYYDILLA